MNSSRFDDVRMRGFRQRASVKDVLALLASQTATLPSEQIPLLDSADRILGETLTSSVHVPGFAKSAMDGFAIRAADTLITSDPPQPLAIVGESLPARPFTGEVQPRQAVRIMTGAPIPTGADAVLMAEYAHLDDNSRVVARESITSGKHVIQIGEDVSKGDIVLPAGRKLRPQDIGLLASIGKSQLPVVRKPRVAILVTGNELLPPGAMPNGFQIVDSNSPMLAALAVRDGANLLPVRYVPDDFASIRNAILTASADADVILISGGTSVGTEDHAPRVVAELGELMVHGVALRPAGPLGIGLLPVPKHTEMTGEKIDKKADSVDCPPALSPARLLFLIPGNPISCLCAYDLFAGRAIRRLGGRSWELPYRKVTLPLACEIVSVISRVDCVRVKLESSHVLPLATRGASNLSNAVAADGFVLVPPDRDRLTPGECVDVWLYDM